MKSEALSIGVIVPVLNEEKNIKQLLLKINNVLQEIPHTICIIDDGSRDQTISIIQSLMVENTHIHLIQHKKTRAGCQRGGASFCALQWLLQNTSHAWIVEVDADGAHRPEELLNGARCAQLFEADVVIASKYVYGSQVIGRSLARRFISFFYSVMARLLFNYRVRDYSNSFRFYSRRAAEYILRLRPQYTSPIYLLEILVILIANRLKVIEVPTQYIERNSGTSKVKLIDLIKGFLGMLDIAARFHLKKYRV